MDECEGAISILIPIGTHHERMPNIRIAFTTNQLSFDEPTPLEDIKKSRITHTLKMTERLLPGRLVGADQGNFNVPAASGAGDVEDDWLTHYPLGNRGDH